MLRPVRDLGKLDIQLSSNELFFSRIKDLHRKNIDMDVYLPSRGMNLQRELVWNHRQKQELIYSLLINRPIPSIKVMSIVNRETNNHDDDILQIIDGKQRLSTLLEFYNNKFHIILEGREFLYNELPEDYQRYIGYHEILCQTAYEDFYVPFTDEDKIKWFNLINFAGTPQDAEHMQKLGAENIF